MLTTKKFYTTEEIIKKLQGTSIKLNSDFEIKTPVNNVKALQNIPLIIIVGEEHTIDPNKESYYLTDLNKLDEIKNALDINFIGLEGLAKGQENNVENTILNAEIELIKIISKNKDYIICGLEDYRTQLYMIKIGLLGFYSTFLKYIQTVFPNNLNNLKLLNEINFVLSQIFQNILNQKNQKISISQDLHILLQNKSEEAIREIGNHFYHCLSILKSLRIYPKNKDEFDKILLDIIKDLNLYPQKDFDKIQKIGNEIIINTRDKYFAENILNEMKERKIAKSILFCGKGHMINVSELIRKYCMSILGTNVNIVLIDIT